ncbi:acyl-CoA carboxylase subunit epsilon [Actinoplanes solisilvae]|uniref:acyl-CoA carboxylase subunit epsilon n=1 Tax=Actinoplanes solisilvae TaxID=2486853 RepID=UPI000FD9A847|nr:acyl-CoA carboxylase subunit epsilon [Actinoplanes solisilvae]
MNTDPLVSVVRGKPTDLETAALVTVLVAASSGVDAAVSPAVGTQPAAKKISSWARSARPSISPRSWKGSALPR